MDPDVAQLMREQRLLEAAQLASERGDARTASTIFERACEWRSAAVESIRAGDGVRALRLAADAGDDATFDEALALLARDAPAAKKAAAGLSARGQHRWAARTLERCGEPIEAGRAWELAGDAQRAAEMLEGAGEVAEAERVLQAALRRNPDAFPLAVSLGALLARFANWEGSVRALQRVPAGAPERPRALLHLRRALAQLGLMHAARCANAELAALRPPHEGDYRHDPPTGTPPARALLFGRYDFVREVASSPQARVIECLDVVRGGRVAVKLFVGSGGSGGGRDALDRFDREVRAIKALEHPNIVPIEEVIVEPTALVMVWMQSGTLQRVLSDPAPIAPARAVEIAFAVLSALSAAHRIGILHRDVKPSNILLDAAGGARLGDFGTAHLGDVSVTADTGVFAYLSPEQREGRPASLRSDLFAVGMVLREMLTGDVPALNEPAARLPSQMHPDLDARHDAVVDRMTARDAQERPLDAIEARDMLAALSWPSTTADIARLPRFEPAPAAASEDRLEALADGTRLDRWTGRKIQWVPLTNETRERARAFALADHEALQTVWRIDSAGHGIWLESLDACALDRPLTNPDRTRLESALDALHAAGVVQGRVDTQQVLMGASGVVLPFLTAQRSSTIG